MNMMYQTQQKSLTQDKHCFFTITIKRKTNQQIPHSLRGKLTSKVIAYSMYKTMYYVQTV